MNNRIGKREREAGKRHRRARFCGTGTEWKTLKLGHKKEAIHTRLFFAYHQVAEAENGQ
ncbi:MAG: hypothetical protein IIB44_11405 [Candidatus Marinimicrobia bacterium]|nr:hypothetical protein [Candidatus Neomarinimicrobiota bacterium]